MTPDPPDLGFRSIQVEHADSAECILRRSMRGGVRQGCALHLLQAGATATATATAEAGFLRGVGVGPVAGEAVNPSLGAWPRHPCRGHPRNRTHPAFDRFPRSVDPCHAWMNLCRISKSIGVRSVFQRKTDLAPGPHVVPGSVQPSPGNCQSWGGVGWQDRWRHGWRHRAPRGEGALLAKHCFASARTHSRQRLGRTPEGGFTACPASPHRPAKPAENQSRFGFGFGLLPASGRHTAGAGRSPADPPSPAHENDFTGFSKPSSLRHASTILRSSMRPRATHAKKRPPIA